VLFQIDWKPDGIEKTFWPRLVPGSCFFHNLDEAADDLQILIAQVMKLRSTEKKISLMGNIPPLSSPSLFQEALLGQFGKWMSLFKNTARRESFYKPNSINTPIITLLRLQHTVAWILLSTLRPWQ
jgi:hypothetical protein